TISLVVRQMRIVAHRSAPPQEYLYAPTCRLESERARAIAGGASLLVAIELTPLDQQLAEEARITRSAAAVCTFVRLKKRTEYWCGGIRMPLCQRRTDGRLVPLCEG